MCLIQPFSGAIVLRGTAKQGQAAAGAEEHRRGQRDRVPPPGLEAQLMGFIPMYQC